MIIKKISYKNIIVICIISIIIIVLISIQQYYKETINSTINKILNNTIDNITISTKTNIEPFNELKYAGNPRSCQNSLDMVIPFSNCDSRNSLTGNCQSCLPIIKKYRSKSFYDHIIAPQGKLVQLNPISNV